MPGVEITGCQDDLRIRVRCEKLLEEDETWHSRDDHAIAEQRIKLLPPDRFAVNEFVVDGLVPGLGVVEAVPCICTRSVPGVGVVVAQVLEGVEEGTCSCAPDSDDEDLEWDGSSLRSPGDEGF